MTTEEKLNERLKKVLIDHNAEFCDCGHEISFGDIAWNEGQTEAGTPTSWIHIQCQACQTEMAWVSSWTWFDEELTDNERLDRVVSILEQDWFRKLDRS